MTNSKGNNKIIGIFGAGGFAREIAPIAIEKAQIMKNSDATVSIEVFFVEHSPTIKELNGIKVLSDIEFFSLSCNEKFFNIGIGDSKVRQKIYTEATKHGVKPLPLHASNATIQPYNEIGEGSVICAYSMITGNSKVGKFFQSNLYSYIGHDCVIGDYVTFAPRASCNGNVHIHDHAYIGAGAIIKQGTSVKPLVIGEGAIVGMGAVVTKDVEPYTTVVGNPAKPLIKQ